MQSKISVNSEKRISTLSHIKPRKSCLGISNFECTQNTACSFSNDFSSNSNPEDTSYIYEWDRREEEWRFIPLRRDPFQTQFKFLKSNRKWNEMQSVRIQIKLITFIVIYVINLYVDINLQILWFLILIMIFLIIFIVINLIKLIIYYLLIFYL